MLLMWAAVCVWVCVLSSLHPLQADELFVFSSFLLKMNVMNNESNRLEREENKSERARE